MTARSKVDTCLWFRKDGISWQSGLDAFGEPPPEPDKQAAPRATQAMRARSRIDIERLEAALRGNA